MNGPLLAALRLLWITDGRGDAARLLRLCEQALRGGLRAVQLREPGLSARALWTLAGELQPMLAACGGCLFVNDRLDVVAAGTADGAQVGHRSLPVAAARRALGPGRLLGASVHADDDVAAAARDGADFALLAPVWPTASKPGAAGLGVDSAARITALAPLPVLWLGGVTAARAAELDGLSPAQRPVGIAVRSAIGDAAEPAAAVRGLLAAFAPRLRTATGASAGDQPNRPET